MMETRSGEGARGVVGLRSKQGVLPILPGENGRKGDGKGVCSEGRGNWSARIEPRPGPSIGCYSQPTRVVGRVGCVVSGQATSVPILPLLSSAHQRGDRPVDIPRAS